MSCILSGVASNHVWLCSRLRNSSLQNVCMHGVMILHTTKGISTMLLTTSFCSKCSNASFSKADVKDRPPAMLYIIQQQLMLRCACQNLRNIERHC